MTKLSAKVVDKSAHTRCKPSAYIMRWSIKQSSEQSRNKIWISTYPNEALHCYRFEKKL
jgi:hypothetical protein